MDKDRCLALLEEIGLQLCEMEAGNRTRRLAGQPPRSQNLDCLEVAFQDAAGHEVGRLGLDRAIHSLAGDIYIFGDFDLTDVVSATVVSI